VRQLPQSFFRSLVNKIGFELLARPQDNGGRYCEFSVLARAISLSVSASVFCRPLLASPRVGAEKLPWIDGSIVCRHDLGCKRPTSRLSPICIKPSRCAAMPSFASAGRGKPPQPGGRPNCSRANPTWWSPSRWPTRSTTRPVEPPGGGRLSTRAAQLTCERVDQRIEGLQIRNAPVKHRHVEPRRRARGEPLKTDRRERQAPLRVKISRVDPRGIRTPFSG
jgi:hypothetical protein